MNHKPFWGSFGPQGPATETLLLLRIGHGGMGHHDRCDGYSVFPRKVTRPDKQESPEAPNAEAFRKKGELRDSGTLMGLNN